MTPAKGQTISKHRTKCLVEKPMGISTGTMTPAQLDVLGGSAAKVAVGEADPDDLAVLVRKVTAQKLRAGELRVTVQHGLIAQGMLDKRAEREKDRELALTIARAIGTFNHTVPDRLVQPRNVTPVIIEETP